MELTPDLIRERRSLLKLSQEELAQRTHITLSTIGKYERGETKPKGVFKVALKRVLNITDE